jgi:SAM-dependent methyltransferase
MATAGFVGSIPEHYDTYSGPAIFEPLAADLVRRVPTHPDGDVLETARGTGILTRALRARLDPAVRLVATDLSDAMFEYARRKLGEPAGVEWRQADAAALPFAPASFAVVACQLGVMFVADKNAAFRQARRVLVDDGLFVFNVWDTLESNPHGRAASEAIAALFPGDPVAEFTKVPYGFNDGALIRRLLTEAGFGEIRFELSKIEIRSASAKSLAIGLVKGTPRSLMLQERGAALDEVIDTVAAALARVGGDAPFRTPAQTLVVTARAA